MKWIHRLLGRELRDRRQHAERVGGQEDDVLRMSAEAGNHGVLDELDRIRRARVLGLAVVVVVGNARDGIEHHVFQHGAEAERVVDLRLGLGREVDALGVAAAFEVEDAVGAPAVLVVADQAALGIGRQRRLAGARQVRRTARSRRPVADVGRAVHGEHVRAAAAGSS